MIDTHAHLFADAFKDDLEDVINKIREAKISKVILVGFSTETNNKTLALASKYTFLYPTIGVHPSEVTNNADIQLSYLKELLKNHKVYAIGECGLDYYHDKEHKNEQAELFKAQIELAISYDLPLIIHCRDALEDTYNILNEYRGKIRGVMHCYSGSYEMAKRFIDLGLYISLGGPVTFKNAVVPKEIATKIDINKLLIETDCPYLAPHPFRGKRNDSSLVSYVLDEIARLRNIDKNELEEIIDKNSNNLFALEV